MVGNFDEDRFHETVMAYTSGRASIRDLEEYAEILKSTEQSSIFTKLGITISTFIKGVLNIILF